MAVGQSRQIFWLHPLTRNPSRQEADLLNALEHVLCKPRKELLQTASNICLVPDQVWGATTGSMKASVESQSAARRHSLQDVVNLLLSSTQASAGEVVNDVSFYPNSGLMFVASDHQCHDAYSRLQL